MKAAGAAGNCAWGSWRSASNPTLRDVHEYCLCFSKGRLDRVRRGESTIERDEFMEATLSVWHAAESACRIGHPAPFPTRSPRRFIELYTFRGDIVIDPFMGSGSTAVAAVESNRRWVGYETEPSYARLTRRRVRQALAAQTPSRRKKLWSPLSTWPLARHPPVDVFGHERINDCTDIAEFALIEARGRRQPVQFVLDDVAVAGHFNVVEHPLVGGGKPAVAQAKPSNRQAAQHGPKVLWPAAGGLQACEGRPAQLHASFVQGHQDRGGIGTKCPCLSRWAAHVLAAPRDGQG